MCPKPAAGGSGINQASEGLSTSSWSRTTGPMCMLSFSGGICIFIIRACMRICWQRPSWVIYQLWVLRFEIRYQDSRVSTLVFGGPMSVVCLREEYVCVALCVCPCVCASGIHVEKTGKQQLCSSVWADTDPGFPDTQMSSKSWAGTAGGHHFTLYV